MQKLSYPNFNDTTPMMPIANLPRWTEAMKQVFVKERLGASRESAINEVIGSWPNLEQFNFKNWLKYYESGDQFKYKRAQYYANDQISYFLPNPAVKPEVPSPLKALNEVKVDADHIVQQNKPGLSSEDKRKIIEDQRRKLISRLNSVEKLLGSQQGHLFAGDDFEKLLHSIYELKKQIQTINKISLSSQTYIDLILRQANKLQHQGCTVAANFLTKFAQQTPSNGQAHLGEVPMFGSVEQGLGALDNPTPPLSELAGTPPIEEEPKEGIDGFLDNLEGAGITNGDTLEANDEVILDDDVILDQEIGPDEEIVVEAQISPNLTSKPEVKEAPVGEVKSPTTRNPQSLEHNTTNNTNNFDALVDAAFDKLTIQDLLTKLQEIQQIFNRKEISKQLSLADLMFSRLGLTQFFPNFAEIQQKTLDATNYASTRMTDIISKLQGSVGQNTIDISGDEENAHSPNILALQNTLQKKDRKEQERKNLRKQVEDQQLQDKVNKEPLVVENPAQELAAEQPKLENSSIKPVAPVSGV